MGKTYYDSTLTDAQIQQVLDAINNILTPSNNGKILAISGGTLEARSVQWGGGYPEPTGTILLTENGLHNVKDYAEANVQVQGDSDIEVIPLTANTNAVYTAPVGQAYSPVTVNVSGTGGNYELLEYIDSDGTQAIDIGQKIAANSSIYIIGIALSGNQSDAWIAGAEYPSSNSYGGFAINTSINKYVLWRGNSSPSEYSSINYSFPPPAGLYSQISSVASVSNCYVFALGDTKQSAGYWLQSKARLCSLTIGNITFLPVRRKSDGICGLWDCANSILLTDIANGNPFTAGPVLLEF